MTPALRPTTPPRFPAALLRALLPIAERDEVLHDLGAEFAYRAAEHGAPRAHAWYWQQTLSSAPSLIRRTWWRGNAAEYRATDLRMGTYAIFADKSDTSNHPWLYTQMDGLHRAGRFPA